MVLEPSATATLVGFLAWIGFAGRAYIEGRSCFDGKEGRQVAAPSISIWDDGTDPERSVLPSTSKGCRSGRWTSSPTGSSARWSTTGARARRPASSPRGTACRPRTPTAVRCPVHGHGRCRRRDDRSTERGLLVTRFHYSNIVNPMESSITGMTRDTFLIERGEVVGPVRNLVHAVDPRRPLERLDGRSRGAPRERVLLQRLRVPALKVDEFHFSGVSDH